jgi:protein-disulfide isomerase
MMIPNRIFDPGRDHFQGSPDSAIELIEYGDFGCAWCALAYTEIKYLQDALGDQLRFVFRYSSSPEQHPLAMQAFKAAEAAGKQGKFWNMHDMIFENHAFLSKSSFRKFGKNIDLNLDQFENDLNDPAIIEDLRSDLKMNWIAGIARTPAIYINGKRYNDFPDFVGLLSSCFHLIKEKTCSQL